MSLDVCLKIRLKGKFPPAPGTGSKSRSKGLKGRGHTSRSLTFITNPTRERFLPSVSSDVSFKIRLEGKLPPTPGTRSNVKVTFINIRSRSLTFITHPTRERFFPSMSSNVRFAWRENLRPHQEQGQMSRSKIQGQGHVPLSQTRQVKGFSPVWVRMWVLRLAWSENLLPHQVQLCGFSPLCVSQWRRNLLSSCQNREQI